MNALYLSTQSESVYLKQLELDDAEAYFEAVDVDRDHLSQFGDTTAAKYPDLESVRQSIEHPQNPDKLRMGIWDVDFDFVGSVNATPLGKEVEVGYWVRQDMLGRGYATIAVSSLIVHLKPNYNRIFAEVTAGNIASSRVLQKSGFWQAGEEGGKLVFDYIGDQVPGQESLFDLV